MGLHTDAAGAPPHSHVATLDDAGNGWTSAGPDGHHHQVIELEVLEAAGHRHQLTTRRAEPGPRPGGELAAARARAERQARRRRSGHQAATAAGRQ